jgi:hypothetical protein
MKKLLLLLFFTFHFSFFTFVSAQTGTWTALTNSAPRYNEGVCLLMTDGTVICHTSHGGIYGTGWDRLTPDIHGSYANGTWDTITPMYHDRLYFAAQVLPTGKVYVAGGEYGRGDTAAEVYDPLTNTWTRVSGVPAGWNLFDGNSEMLYNGNVLEGPQIVSSTYPSSNTLLYSPATNRFSIGPNAYYGHAESSWLKLRDSSVLYVGYNTDSSNRYIPQLNKWVRDDTVPGSLYNTYAGETGPVLMLPNGKALFTGGLGYNALYTPSNDTNPGTFKSADSFPVIGNIQVCTMDASAAMMNNGHALISVEPVSGSAPEFRTPCYFLEYDYTTNTFAQVTSIIPGFGADSMKATPSFQTNMLVLPDGNIFVSQWGGGGDQYYIYTPGSGPIPQGKPTIDNITNINCNYYRVTGKLFNGISEGASYGDDWQIETNYPLVRLTDGTNVYYARTSNWNRIGAIETDSLADTAYFTLPSLPGGTYSVVVVVNGFASNPVMLTTFGVAITSTTNLSSCSTNTGSATATAADGILPYTYLWSPSGGTNSTASNLSTGTYIVTVTDGGGCTSSASVTIYTAAMIASTSVTAATCANEGTGSMTASVTGGTPPYTYLWNPGSYTGDFVNWVTAGTYTVLVSDSCGNTATATAFITSPPLLTVVTDSINSGTSDPCNGEAWVTVNGGVRPYTYLWIPGLQTGYYITGQCPGSYCCEVTDANGCTQTACVNVLTTGIEQLSVGSGQLTVYPNPGGGEFNVICHPPAGGSQSITIYNVLGETIFTETLRSAKDDNLINLSNQPNGIYFYRVLNNDGSVVGDGKLIIKK